MVSQKSFRVSFDHATIISLFETSAGFVFAPCQGWLKPIHLWLCVNFDCIGPFVMNTADQIKQAIEDYSFGRNGFERAPGWQSEIGKQR